MLLACPYSSAMFQRGPRAKLHLQRRSNYFHGRIYQSGCRADRATSMTCFRTEAGLTIELSGNRGPACCAIMRH
jgi:hypothetical protein